MGLGCDQKRFMVHPMALPMVHQMYQPPMMLERSLFIDEAASVLGQPVLFVPVLLTSQ